MSEEVSTDTVRHVAALARIEVSESDLERYATEFERILEHFETLDAVPTVERPSTRANVLRSDRRRAGLDRGEALENADGTEDGYFRGPPVS